ncbi:MAG: NTP transferase domain-containing protein [bacterium]|nr:NTP transferase domain-containing protein [bacterium]
MAIHLVLLAGGRGTRFWPLSRRRKPKQLLPLLNEHSLLRNTWDRVRDLSDAEHGWVITADDLAAGCMSELPELPPSQIIGEPVGRNTAPALALAGILAEASDPDAVLAVFPSDHHISNGDSFRDMASAAIREAESGVTLMTLGIRPDRPETGYGYIATAPGLEPGAIAPVDQFVEKPDLATAEGYVEGGRHLWNSGMFFFSVRALRASFLEHAPEIWNTLAPLGAEFGTKGFAGSLRDRYQSLPSVAFDVAIMERAANVKVIPVDFAWNDVGHWLALGMELPEVEGNSALGDLLTVNAKNNIVVNHEGLTALVGVEDLVVVRSGDAVLVCHRDQAQALREVVRRLEETDRAKYL